MQLEASRFSAIIEKIETNVLPLKCSKCKKAYIITLKIAHCK
jgi:hypothetical protein